MSREYFKEKTCTGYKSFNEYGFKVESSSHNDCQNGFIKLLASGDWAIPDLDGQPEEPKWLRTWRTNHRENKDLSGIVNIQKEWTRDIIAQDFVAKL